MNNILGKYIQKVAENKINNERSFEFRRKILNNINDESWGIVYNDILLKIREDIQEEVKNKIDVL